MTQQFISETDLQAYVDDRLSDAERAEVEDYLATHPEDARRLSGYSRINSNLHGRFDVVLKEEIPDRLLACFRDQEEAARRPVFNPFASILARLRGLSGRLREGRGATGILVPASPGSGWRPAAYAATAAWVSLGVVLGWQMQHALPQGEPPMVRHAAVAYATYASEVAHPVEIQASNEDQLEAWLSKRLGMDLRAPELEAVGFKLMGGRLLAGTQGPAAQFMYEDSIGRRLTLYVKTQEMGYDESKSFTFAREKEINAFYWIEEGTGYVLSGNLDRSDLLKVAQAAHRELDAPREERPKKSASRPGAVIL